MTDLCAVNDCRQPGTEDVDGKGTILCDGHADRWERSEEARSKRLVEMAAADTQARHEELWAEHVSEWCGKQEGI